MVINLTSQLEDLLCACEVDSSPLFELLTIFSDFAAQSKLTQLQEYGTKIVAACKKWENEDEAIKGVRLLCEALTHYYSTRFDQVEKPALKAIELLDKTPHRDLYGLTCMIYGANNRSLGNLDTAVRYLHKSASIIDPTGPLAIYNSYSNYQLAEINNFIEDLEAAERYYNKAVDVAQLLPSLTGRFRTYNGIANFYLSTQQYDLCKAFLDKSLSIEGLSASQKSRSQCDLGVYYYTIGDYGMAENILKENYEVRSSAGLEDASSTTLIELANVQLKLGKTEQAIEQLTKALAITSKFNSKSKALKCHRLLAKAHKSLGNWQASAEAFDTYDSLQAEQNKIQLKNIYRIKNDQIAQQKKLVEDIYEEVQDSIRYAKRIQRAILPSNKLVKELLPNCFILYKPKDIVAGDFYWLEPKDETVYFAAADCTGHGVPGAMVSVICNNGLNRSVREYGLVDPGEILNATRELVIKEFEKSEEEVKDGMDIALCALKGTTLNYAGAHNPLWIIRKDSDEIQEIKADKQPIGKFDMPSPYTTHNIELSQGDSFYIFSDGYADQFGGPKRKKYMSGKFKKLLLSIQGESMNEQKLLIDKAFEEWKGQLEQLDDVCVIGVKL